MGCGQMAFCFSFESIASANPIWHDQCGPCPVALVLSLDWRNQAVSRKRWLSPAFSFFLLLSLALSTGIQFFPQQLWTLRYQSRPPLAHLKKALLRLPWFSANFYATAFGLSSNSLYNTISVALNCSQLMIPICCSRSPVFNFIYLWLFHSVIFFE